MALFFSLDVLEHESCNDINRFLGMLEAFYKKRLPTKYTLKYFTNKSLVGGSYLLNPDLFFNDKTTDPIYKIQYIKLAARRDYLLFKQYRYIRLQRSYFPDLNIENISTNPLLTITATEILFKYEEER